MAANFAQDSSFPPDSPLYRTPVSYLRGSMGRFATGVAVVTFDAPDGPHGITVNSFTSVSMDPPLVLVSLQRTARSHDLLRGKAFTVNVLGSEQQDIALRFAGKPLPEPRWERGELAPRLGGVLSWLECSPWAEYDGGDHTLFIGEVERYNYRSGDALGFASGQFTVIPEARPGHEALF